MTSTTDGQNHTSFQTWNVDGQLATYKDADNNTTVYTYDPRGDVATRTTPGGKITTNTYDLDGNVTLTAAPGASCTGTPTAGCTTATYDHADQLTAQSYLDGGTSAVTSIGYDPDGRPTGQTDTTGTSTWSYDSLGRMTKSVDGQGFEISYGYDLNGNQTGITYPGTSHTVTEAYDPLNRLASLTDWLNHTTSYTYDQDSDPTITTLPTGTGEKDTAGYNQLDQLTSITDTQKTGSTTTTLAALTYTRGNNTFVIGSTATGPTEANQTYAYNGAGYVVNSGSTSTPTVYNYDHAGNMISRGTTSGGAASTMTVNSDDQLCWTKAATVTGPTCGTAPSGATTFTYNNNGDSDSQHTQHWQRHNLQLQRGRRTR